MALPDYQRPFEASDFRGYFTWSSKLTKVLGIPLRHACHEDELDSILAEEHLGLRSSWSLMHPVHGEWSAPCSWCGLNTFARGNYYGPFRISFPLDVLDGRTFMALRRVGDRRRYFFVQYEAGLPLFSVGDNPWRRVKATAYFDTTGSSGIHLKDRAIYDVVLTTPLPLDRAVIEPVSHPTCVPRKCDGTTRDENLRVLRATATELVEDAIAEAPGVQRLLRRFPSMNGRRVRVWDEE